MMREYGRQHRLGGGYRNTQPDQRGRNHAHGRGTANVRCRPYHFTPYASQLVWQVYLCNAV